MRNRLVERFTLRGLYGYKDITIDFAGAATIVVAENGAGKTTLLGALNAFLSRRFHRLSAFAFERLECKFFDDENVLVLRRDELDSSATQAIEAVRTISKTAQVNEDELADFLQHVYSPEKFDSLLNTSILHTVYLKTPGGHLETKAVIDEAHRFFKSHLSARLLAMGAQLREKLGDVEIIYLPTYRRIERPMLRPTKRTPVDRSGFRATPRDDVPTAYEGIAFGLSDIQARLGEITEEIERSSNFGYRALSARMLEDMLKGRSANFPDSVDDLPEVRALSLFLGRLGRVENNLGRIFDNIGALYETKEILQDEYKFLRYFLVRLKDVIDETKTMEQRIQRFVLACNGYLKMSSDEKQLTFDSRTLKVAVENTWAGCLVPLDALSSGEKQIISLMAKLHLDEKEKIVLIDEPELSLSIDWQRRVLPDVMNSGSVLQMLAITHSPFVFENELDSYARGMGSSRSLGAQLELPR